MRLIIFIISTIFLTAGTTALAQSSLEGLPSGRWEIRKVKKNTKSNFEARKPSSEAAVEPPPEPTKDPEKKPDAEIAKDSIQVQVNEPNKTNNQENSPDTSNSFVLEKPKEFKQIVDANTTETQLEEPGFYEQFESLFSGSKDKIKLLYLNKLHSQDIRRNRVEVEFSPTLIYNESKSNYSFRSYQTFFEAAKLKANVWFTPTLGVSSQILISVGADLDDANQTRVATHYENLDLSFNFRRFFGVSREVNSMEISLLLSDYSTKVSKESTLHPRLKSVGFGLGLKARVPTSENFSWVFGGNFYPQLQHSESATAVNINSGDSDTNLRMGLDVGGEWTFSRRGAMIIDFAVSSEKNIFSGNVNLPDTDTGLSPKNVGVANTLYMFNLGYRWGH